MVDLAIETVLRYRLQRLHASPRAFPLQLMIGAGCLDVMQTQHGTGTFPHCCRYQLSQS
jgi:hypothetical protein